jgi:hypothetical protein
MLSHHFTITSLTRDTRLPGRLLRESFEHPNINLRSAPRSSLTSRMGHTPYVTPTADSTAVFKPDIFKGKVLFCTGGGSGICRGMTEAMVSICRIQEFETKLIQNTDASWCKCHHRWTKVSAVHICYADSNIKVTIATGWIGS